MPATWNNVVFIFDDIIIIFLSASVAVAVSSNDNNDNGCNSNVPPQIPVFHLKLQHRQWRQCQDYRWQKSSPDRNCRRADWENCPQPSLRLPPGLVGRFETAVRQFAQHEKLLRQADIQETFQHLQQRSRLCARLEAELETQREDDSVLPSTRQEWATLPNLPAALAAALQQRFDTVCQALAGAPDQMQAARACLEHDLERKQIWCVCMEIVAGVDSPPEFAQLRMEYQVARLSASLAGTAAKTEALYDPHRLQEQWCLTGALPAKAAAELDNRFLHAARVWWQREEV